MATAGVSSQRFEGVRLVTAPTDLSAAYPYGGTEIGFASHVVFRRNVERTRIIAQEYGRKTVRSSYNEFSAILSVKMRAFDPAFLALLPGGSSSGNGSVTSSTSSAPQPGVFLTRAKLLLVPEADRRAGEKGHGVGLILYAATVLNDAADVMRWSETDELLTPVVWEAEIDDTGRDHWMGLLSEMSL